MSEYMEDWMWIGGAILVDRDHRPVGDMTISRSNYVIHALPGDEATQEFFAGDAILKLLGKHGHFDFNAYDGLPLRRFPDEDDNRHKQSRVVPRSMYYACMIPDLFDVDYTSAESDLRWKKLESNIVRAVEQRTRKAVRRIDMLLAPILGARAG